MELTFYGGNCFRIKTKNTSLVVDDNLSALGAKSITKKDEVLIFTSKDIVNKSAASSARLVLEGPGEFEVGDISIQSVATRSHMDEKDQHSATVFQCMFEGATVTVLGHIHPDMSEELQELAAGTDVLVIPVGGNGYTLDPIGATSVIKKLDPTTVIPAHYEDDELKFEVPATPLEEFVKISSLPAAEPTDIFKIGKVDPELEDKMHLQVLIRR